MNGSNVSAESTHEKVFAVTTDLHGNILATNAAFAEVTGYQQSELIGKHFAVTQHTDTPQSILTEALKKLQQSKQWTGALKLKKTDGAALWFNAAAAPDQTRASSGYQWIFTRLGKNEIAETDAAFRRIRAGKKTFGEGIPGRWFNKISHAPLGKRIAMGVSTLVALVSIGLTIEAMHTSATLVDEETSVTLKRYKDVVSTSVNNQAQSAISLASMVANMPEVKKALIERDRPALLREFQDSFTKLKSDYGFSQFQFHTPDAHSFLRVHKPAKYGDDLSGFRQTIVQALKEQRPVGGIEQGKAGFGIRGVVPIKAGNRIIGSVELGKAFDQRFFDAFKQKHHVDVGFFRLKDNTLKKIGSTFGDTFTPILADSEGALEGKNILRDLELMGKPFKVSYSILTDYSGAPIGLLAVGMDQSKYVNLLASKRNILLAAGIIAFLMSIVVAYLLARSISKPINQAVSISRAIANGKYNNAISVKQNDETGTLLETMGLMQAQLAYKIHQEHETSEANARIKTALDYISTNVTVSNAQGKLIFMNNACQKLFSEIGQERATNGRPFNPQELIGKSLANDFFQDAKLRDIFGKQLRQSYDAEFSTGDRVFDLGVHPVYDETGEYRGRVTQWSDITAERTAEQEIESIVSAAKQGDLSERVEVKGKKGFFELLAVNLNELLDGVDNVFSEIDGAMKRLAAGNLTTTIDKEYSGKFESLKLSVNGTMSNLQGMVGNLRQSAQEISGSAQEISSSNEELNNRTERQSTSLESTAAALEEITGTVGQNAENAHLATDLAVQAQKVSKQGVEVVHEAIDAMGSINDSSAKIEEIISVIDEIAFQTNLLALNAAVEAARAGDMGRGFAVVANEVRALAGRSSDAAKEIKVLITDSVEKVHNGTKLVNRTGSALDEITTSIEKVNSIMSEIASANQEQSIGISQINHSVTQLDDATNQNTGLAQQTYRIAESLKVKAQEMDQMIGQFEIESSSGFGRQDDYLRAV
ncbi:MAG: methyl-accepting chemotaxis protein [Thiotrichales bacterium]